MQLCGNCFGEGGGLTKWSPLCSLPDLEPTYFERVGPSIPAQLIIILFVFYLHVIIRLLLNNEWLLRFLTMTKLLFIYNTKYKTIANGPAVQ